ncbi:DUF6141 family protein [Sporosarcina sp. SAFN-010]|uniref:DUF6141 family protein n=1 Tax=Sporosarcina sp. SAFN-010 TaxID=3387273 RepID=UPI003F7E7988
MDRQIKVLYREIQRPQQIWLWMLILLEAAYMWYWFIQQIAFDVPLGNNPASDVVTIIFWMLFGVTLPVLMLGVLKLIIEVRSDGIYVRLFPFQIHYKQYLFKEISNYETLTYSPLKRFGGWGIRFNSKGETAYNLNGKKGVELRLKYNKVVIGTQKPDELKKAIDSVHKVQ